MSAVRDRDVNPYGRAFGAGVLATPAGSRLKAAGEMGALLLTVLRLAIRPPYPWAREAIQQMSFAFRRCAIPLVLSHSVYLTGFGIILFGGILNSLGIADRIGGTVYLIWSREIATWITAMIFAGVVGSAITADLGARKIREELDAMSVLGVDKIATIVVPRVVAMALAMPALAFISLLGVNLVNFAVSPGYFGFSSGVFFDSVKNVIEPLDLYLTMFLKNFIIGLFVGIVACYKGLSSAPGAEGVGRAVNQTVVITFFWIWLFDVVFNLAYFTLFPDVSVLRG
jgi:phospholipid/cholesterol/gamma-HCH transport system permease protein